MGPFCQFCGHRCFVERFVPGSHITILATCAKGMEHDRLTIGHSADTALNPHDPIVMAYAAAITENVTDSAQRAERHLIASTIERVCGDPDAQRPEDCETDWEWAAKIARDDR